MRLSAPVQTKLTVGTAGDRYEREADHVAERVSSGRSAGEISRIPPGGLKAQRQAEEGGEQEAQTLAVQRQAEGSPASEQEPSAQAVTESAEPQAQAQSEPPEEGQAQAKCAACDGEDRAQRQEQEPTESAQAAASDTDRQETAQAQSEPAGKEESAQKQSESAPGEESAQAKCVSCEQEEKAQRAPAEDESAQGKAASEDQTAQPRAEQEGAVQRQEEGGEEEAETEPEGEEAEEATSSDEDAAAPECGAAEGGGSEAAEGEEAGGAEAAGEEGAGGEEGAEREPSGEAEGGGEAAAREVGCGEEGGEGEEAVAPAAGGAACGATTEAGAEGEGGGEGAEPEAAPAALAGEGAAAAGGSVPACAAEVEAAREEPEAAEAEGGGEPAAAGAEGECRARRTEDESEGAAQTKEDEEQAAQTQEQEEAQTREDDSTAQSTEEEAGAVQAEEKGREEPAQRQQKDTGEESAQTEAEEESSAAQTQEEEAAPEREEQQAQRRSSPGRGRRLQTHVAARHMHARGAGEPLLPSVRERVEATLGVDLEGVRVHADSNAQAASKALRARAFTHRNHIFLGPGQSQHDVGLMAHESTHVLQQDGIVRRKPKNEPLRAEPAAPAPAPLPAPSAPAAPAPAAVGPAAAAPVVAPSGPAPSPEAAASLTPGVARTPGPMGPVPVPYPSVAAPSPAAAKKVAVPAGRPRAAKSAVPASKGEEPGTAAGPKSVVSSKMPAPPMPLPLGAAPSPALPAAPAAAPPALAGPMALGPTAVPPSAALATPVAAGGPAVRAAAAPPAAPGTETPAASAAPSAAPETAGAPAAHGGAKPETAAQAAAGATEQKTKAVEAEKQVEKQGALREAMAAAPAPQPQADARFQGVMARVDASAAREKTHAPAKDKAGAARAAVEPPENERPSRAEQQQVQVMEQQPDVPPEPKDFLTVLREKIEEIAPKNMEETLEFKSSGKAGQMKATLTKKVGEQREAATGPLRRAADAAPNVDAIPQATPTPLAPEPADPGPTPLHAEEVLPQPKPDAEISAEENKQKAEALMAENDIDEDQLERASEPQFSQALEAKRELEAHADQVPEHYRKQEQALLKGETGEIAGQEGMAQASMREARTQSKSTVRSKQDEAKKREEAERRKISEDIRGIYRDTKNSVEEKLSGLDSTVGSMFEEGERIARDQFESYVQGRMEAYKDERYSGVIGKGKWIYDKIAGMPDEVNAFYAEGRERYIAAMGKVLEGIATTVDTELAAAKKLIGDGKRKIADYVDKLEPRLQGYGKEAQDAISGDFDTLEGSVEDKKQTLADDLAQRYRESRQQLDDRIEELKAENQGLLDKFIGFIKQVIEVLRKLKDMIVLLVKVGGEIVRGIAKDPSGFLDNLLSAIGKGFNQFSARIGEHLQHALFEYISGTVREAGVTAPQDASPSGVFGMVLQILGITVEKIRAKVVRLIGPRNVERIELAWKTVSGLLAGGAEGLWERVKGFVGDLKARVMSQVKEWVIAQIVRRGIEFLLSLFNPVTALLRAIKMIYDLLMFFVENIERIVNLVNAVLQSVSKVVMGNIAAAANWIENSLARGLTLLIAFLARLLGLSGLGERIRAIIKRVQRPVERAIDAALRVIVRGFKWLGGKGKALIAKGKGAAARLFEWWRLWRPFSAGGEKHRLSFRGRGKAAQLMVSSTPQTLEDYLGTLRAKGATPAQVAAIRRKAAEVDGLKHDVKSEKDIPMTKTQGQKIAQGLADLATALSAATPEAAVPPTRVAFREHSAEGDAIGGEMKAEPLSIRPGNTTGSEPTQESVLWRGVRARGVYVQGHLLNHHLHGPGERRNLTPITNSLNQTMERQVESRAKKLVLGENQVVSYSVKADYAGHGTRKHLAAESRLATGLTFQIKLMTPPNDATKRADPGAWTPGKDAGDYSKRLDHELPPDEPVGEAHADVNLSRDDADKIAAAGVPGLGPAYAARIAERAKARGIQYHSYSQIEDLGIPPRVVRELEGRPWIKLH